MSDAYFANVGLLLPFEQDAPGPCGYLDYSNSKLAPITWTSAALSSSQSKFGGLSAVFDGTSNSVIRYTSVNLALDDNNHTVETWIYPTSLSQESGIFTCCLNYSGSGLNCIRLYVESTGAIRYIGTGASQVGWDISSAVSTITLNSWQHVAAVRSGSTVYIFVNGNQVATGSVTAGRAVSTSPNYNFIVGFAQSIASNSRYFTGYMDDFRATNSTARYTANFTPPTALKGDAPTPFTFSPKAFLVGKKPKKSWFDWTSLTPIKKARVPRNSMSVLQWSALSKKCVIEANAIAAIRHDLNPTWAGTGTVSGISEISTFPVKSRVRLYDNHSGLLIREVITGDDGVYSFTGLRIGLEYTVTAVDLSRTYNDVIAARVTAV